MRGKDVNRGGNDEKKEQRHVEHVPEAEETFIDRKGGSSPQQSGLKSNLIVIGNEAHGLPSSWQKKCDQLVTLPMPGGTESLNAAVAGSIALYLAYVV